MTIRIWICLILFLASSEILAETPRVAVFVYYDSLATEIDCSELFGRKRVELLEDGYPLSFVLTITLYEDQKLWLNTRVATASSRFRIEHRKWDDRFSFKLRDFSRAFSSGVFESLEEITVELEERLFTTFGIVSDLDSTSEYYFEVEIEYRDLTFDDVRSVELWLKEGGSIESIDSSGQYSRSIIERALGLLWDMAVRRAEKENSATERFRLSVLRRGE